MKGVATGPSHTYECTGERLYVVNQLRPTVDAARLAARIMHLAFSDRYVGMSEDGGEEVQQGHIDATVSSHDLVYLHRLRRNISQSHTSPQQSRYAVASLVVGDGLQDVGFAKFSRGPQGHHDHHSPNRIEEIDVLPKYQGQGAGKALLRYGLEFMREARSERVDLYVLRENPSAEVYKQWGFVVSGMTVEVRPFVHGPELTWHEMAADIQTVDDTLSETCKLVASSPH